MSERKLRADLVLVFGKESEHVQMLDEILHAKWAGENAAELVAIIKGQFTSDVRAEWSELENRWVERVRTGVDGKPEVDLLIDGHGWVPRRIVQELDL